MLRASPEAMAAALERVDASEDAAVMPLLAPAECQEFIDAGADLSFRSAKPVIGEGERAVYQDFDICLSIPQTHRLWQLTQAVERLIAAALGTMAEPPLEALSLNDLVLQRYPPGARGITPHRDHVRYVGLVAIVQMSGDGRFGLCEDRSGAGARVLDAGPGDGILMRAPGFGGQPSTGRSTSSTGSRSSATASACAATRRRNLRPPEYARPAGRWPAAPVL